MNEPISFRSITDLEEVETLDDGAYIVVIENGTAKQISKANAKFGGGSVTKYILTEASTQAAQGDVAVQATITQPSYTITNEDGSEVTAQEVYDAFMAGPVILEQAYGGGYSMEDVVPHIYWQGGTTGNGDPTNVNYVQLGATVDGNSITITIGTEMGGK